MSIDSGLSLRLGATVVDAVGEMLELGEAPFHSDVEAQVAVEDGALREEGWRITFGLTTSSPSYQPSEEYTLIYNAT